MFKLKALEHIHDSDRAEFLSVFRQNGSNWPQILNSEHVTRLILLQKLSRLGLVDYSPLDDPEFVAAVGGEGVEAAGCDARPTGQTPQKNFCIEKRNSGTETLLELLKSLEIYVIELKPLDRFERAVLSKARILLEAELDHRRKTKNRWQCRVNRQRAQWRRRNRKKREKRLMAKQKVELKGGGEKETFQDQGGEKELSRDQGDEKEAVQDQVEEAKPPRTIESQRPEVELEIIRVGPNPRLLQCRYKLLAEERKVYVWVKTNKNFVHGMRLRMKEEEGSDWHWEGALPRFRGRW
jgi:hypothetical protein